MVSGSEEEDGFAVDGSIAGRKPRKPRGGAKRTVGGYRMAGGTELKTELEEEGSVCSGEGALGRLGTVAALHLAQAAQKPQKEKKRFGIYGAVTHM